MKSKPEWGFWLICVIGYAATDLLISAMLHGGFEWNQVRGAVEGGLFGGTATWLFAWYKWHKADSGI